MAEIKFTSFVSDASFFKKYTTNNDFSHFVFQASNEDSGDRKTFLLVLYQVNKSTAGNPDPEPIPVTPTGWKPVKTKGLNKLINLGNLILSKAALIKLFDQNEPFDYLGFIADKLGAGKFEKYVQYNVLPTDAQGKPKSSVGTFSTELNPSPPAGTFE